MRFIVDVCSDDPDLQIMYGIGGEKDLTERRSTTSAATAAPRPVRIGNGAFDQRQNDVWGALLDSIYLHEKALRGTRHAGRPRADPLPGGSGDRGLAASRPGDLGVARRAPALRLLEADDLGRGRPRRPPRRAAAASTSSPSEWQADRRRDPRRRSSSAASATASSASTTRPTRSTPRPLLIPLLRFLPPDDQRVRATVEAIAARPDRARPRPPLQGRGDRRRPAAARRGPS